MQFKPLLHLFCCASFVARNMTFAEMDAFMEELAKKFKDDHKLDEDAAKQQIAQKLTKTKPKSHGTTVRSLATVILSVFAL